MTPEQMDASAAVLRLADEEYFTLADERRMDLADAFSHIANEGAPDNPSAIPPGLSIGAPRQIDPATRATVPVLVGSFETGLRGWQVNFKPNLRLFVKSRSTGELLGSTPLVSMRRGTPPLKSGVGEPPQGAEAAVTRTSVVPIDLRERLGDRLTPGEIAVTAVAYDVRSNTARIAIEGDDPPTTATATKRPYVRYDLDERPHIDEEIVVPDHGSVSSGWRIRVATQLSADDGILRTDLNQPFLPSHVVLVRLDEPPIVVPASPPVQQIDLTDSRQLFNALFLVELGGEQGAPVPAGEYQLYLDLGVRFLGPYPITVGE
jgi:hypothetical protein